MRRLAAVVDVRDEDQRPVGERDRALSLRLRFRRRAARAPAVRHGLLRCGGALRGAYARVRLGFQRERRFRGPREEAGTQPARLQLGGGRRRGRTGAGAVGEGVFGAGLAGGAARAGAGAEREGLRGYHCRGRRDRDVGGAAGREWARAGGCAGWVVAVIVGYCHCRAVHKELLLAVVPAPCENGIAGWEICWNGEREGLVGRIGPSIVALWTVTFVAGDHAERSAVVDGKANLA